jgi:hypothetical protein
MTRYREKPTTVEAFRYTSNTLSSWPEWARAEAESDVGRIKITGDKLLVRTLNGDKHALQGEHWIIRSDIGSLATLRNDVFERVYEKEPQR